MADSLYIVKEYEQSYNILEQTFSRFEPIDMEIYNELITYIKLKILLKKDVSYDEFTRLISVYGYTESYLKNDDVLGAFYEQNEQQLIHDTPQLQKQYLSSINLDLRNQILRMKSEDQLYRDNYGTYQEEQTRIDSTNTEKLIHIFNTYGFPSKKLIGEYSVDNNSPNINALLLHTRDSIREHYFIPKVKEYVHQGKANPRLVGTMYDQLLLYDGFEQYYGTYSSSPITEASEAEINRRRASIGLPSYGYEDWRYRILYPEFK
ncbi:MAG: hypothetical protein AAF611_07910 [Bacteroidota bacterium]